MDGWLLNLTRFAAVTIGLMAGIFFVFSVAIMPALDRMAAHDGMKAMQNINDDIKNPLFLLVFMGSGLAGAALAASTIWTWDQPGAGYRLAGGLLAFLGSLVLTVVYHVPRNNDLDAAVAGTPRAPGRQVLGPPQCLIGKSGERLGLRDRQSPDQVGEHRQGGPGVGQVCSGGAALNKQCA